MASVTRSVNIDAPREQVFAAFSDLEKCVDRIEAITKMEVFTSGPMRVGTRFRETRTMFGKKATEEMKVTGFESPGSYKVEAHSHGAHYISTYQFADHAGGTKVDLTFEVRPESFMARLFSPLSKFMLKSVSKSVSKDMGDLKKSLEA